MINILVIVQLDPDVKKHSYHIYPILHKIEINLFHMLKKMMLN